MKTITRIRKVCLVSIGDEDYEQEAVSLSENIFDLTRNLYSYSFRTRYHLYKELTNDGIMQEFDIAKDILNYECDEVWVFGTQVADISMGGANAFWLGSNPVRTLEHIHRRFPFMRFGENEMPLKTYARRVENTMYRVYQGYPPAKNMWAQFIDLEDCGTVNCPPNGVLGGYSSKKTFLSYADDWLTYPNFRNRIRYMDSSEWGGTMEGYMKWWLRHIPHGEHKLDGVHENWWHYVMNLDNVK